MTRSASRRDRRRPVDPAPSGGIRAWTWGFAVAVVAACLAGWLVLWRGNDLVDKTLDMERTLLAGEASGRAGRRTLDAIIRNVDRMQPDELREVQRTLDEEWQRTTNADIEAYFAAKPAERHSILDRSIDRMLIYKELRFAVNPKAWSKDGRKPRKPRMNSPGAQAAGATAAEKKAQQQLLERYDDALRQRARERRIELPAWQ
ncbi:MAG: hypothetical protein ACKOBP_15155 [Planctomycetia bacterium]